MTSNLDRYKNDLEKLVALGNQMELDLHLRAQEAEGGLNTEQQDLKKKVHRSFEKNYQQWYTESCSLVRQMLPGRLSEFESLYKGEGRRKDVNVMTYTIQDWLMGVRSGIDRTTRQKIFDDFSPFVTRFQTQRQIVQAVERRFESTLFDIKQLVQADLFDSELDTARELQKKGFFRASGVIAGVVLEAHLSQVCQNHSISTRKKNRTISDYNDLLKDGSVIDIPLWRFIQRLGDLRNLCGHNKEREPTKEETLELIDGVYRISKTLY